jgi:hypothetical protein
LVDPAGTSSQGRVRFRLGGDFGDRNGMGVPDAGELLNYFCQLMPCVSLLVFLLVSAAICDENHFKFNWLWY